METAVLLARVSTYGQVENGTSLEAQEQWYAGFLRQQNWRSVGIFREDGVSGALYLSRDGLQSALQKIVTGEARHFITTAVDRTGRDVDILRAIRKQVLDAGGQFWASGTEYPATPEGDLMFTQFAMFAEYERSTIRKRTMSGRERKAKAGEQPYRTFSAYGFHVVAKKDVLSGAYAAELIGKYTVVPEQARWAREMAERYAAGSSLPDIQKWLLKEGVKTAKGLDKWSISSIRRTISHPAMVGRPVVGKTKRGVDEGRLLRGMKRIDFAVARPQSEWIILACDPIVSEEVYEECQRRLQENKARLGGNPTRRYKLGGMTVCPVCGRIMAGSKSKKGRYYTCPYDRGCKWRWNALVAEEWAERGVRTVVQDKGLSRAAIQAYKMRNRASTKSDRVADFTKSIAEIDKQERILVDLQFDAMLNGRSAMVYEKKLEGLNIRRNTLRGELEVLQLQRTASLKPPLTSAEMITSVLSDVHEALESPHLTDVEKNELLSEVVTRIEPSLDRSEVTLVLRSFF